MTQSLIERSTYTVIPDPNGQFMPYKDPGGYDWRTDTPDRPDSATELLWKIVAEYPDGSHKFLYYWNGRFRQASGNPQAVPARWYYMRCKPEVWHPVWNQWVLPGTVVPPVVTPPVGPAPNPAVDKIVAGLMLIATPRQIQDSMDRNMALNDTGAPETPGAME